MTIEAGAGDFNGIKIARGFKDIKNHNPCMIQKFRADPGLLEYNGFVYVYSTNDGTLQDWIPEKNV